MLVSESLAASATVAAVVSVIDCAAASSSLRTPMLLTAPATLEAVSATLYTTLPAGAVTPSLDFQFSATLACATVRDGLVSVIDVASARTPAAPSALRFAKLSARLKISPPWPICTGVCRNWAEISPMDATVAASSTCTAMTPLLSAFTADDALSRLAAVSATVIDVKAIVVVFVSRANRRAVSATETVPVTTMSAFVLSRTASDASRMFAAVSRIV